MRVVSVILVLRGVEELFYIYYTSCGIQKETNPALFMSQIQNWGQRPSQNNFQKISKKDLTFIR